MFPAQKIVVGVDGRQGGRDAITLARRLAAPDAELVLVHVWALDILTLEDRSRDAVALLAREASRAGVRATLDTIGDGRGAGGLGRLVARHAPDIVVLGASHRSAFGRVVVGDLGKAAIRDLDRPVLIAPRGGALGTAGIVGVGWDETAVGEAALDAARELARATGADVRLLHAVEPPPVGLASPAAPLLVPGITAAELARARRATDTLGDVPGVVTVGAAGTALLELSETVDVLVMGAGRHGLLHRLLLGSPADAVLHGAHCPVLFVPPPAGTARTAAPLEAELVVAS